MNKPIKDYLNLPYFGFSFDEYTNLQNMSNKLFCTFVLKPDIPTTVQQVKDSYHILYDKIFVLSLENDKGYVCTYNVDSLNLGGILDNTILVHRKKHTNTLYTINALNSLIKELNGGVLDRNYPIYWDDYKNSILLIRDNVLEVIKTDLYEVIYI